MILNEIEFSNFVIWEAACREFPSDSLKKYGRNSRTASLREILLVVLTKRSQLYIFSKRYQKFCKTYQYLKVDGTKYAANFFCKIDQIQVVWEMRIFYYCMPCLHATSKQKDDRTTVLSYNRLFLYDSTKTLIVRQYCRTIVFLFRRVRTRKAAQFFDSSVKNEQWSRGIGEQCYREGYQHW